MRVPIHQVQAHHNGGRGFLVQVTLLPRPLDVPFEREGNDGPLLFLTVIHGNDALALVIDHCMKGGAF